jgi:hypothetical protein
MKKYYFLAVVSISLGIASLIGFCLIAMVNGFVKIAECAEESQQINVGSSEKKAAERDKKNIGILYSQAKALIKEKKWLLARDTLQKIIAADQYYLDAKELLDRVNKEIDKILREMRAYNPFRVDITVESVEKRDLVKGVVSTYEPEEGNIFIVVGVTLYNGSGDSYHANPANFVLFDSEDIDYGYHSATHNLEDEFAAGDLMPREKVCGKIVFQIKSGNEPMKLGYPGLDGESRQKRIIRTK